MKVAHFAEFGPSRSGLYGTTRDLIMAEKMVGIDAVFVDSHVTKAGKIVSRPNLKDGDLPIVSAEEAKDADILVHHSIIHQELRNLGIPIVLALHGRPESTFLLEHRKVVRGIYGAQMEHGADPRYKAFFTFWKEHLFHHSLMVPLEKLHFVPAPVDLKRFSPPGTKHDFKGHPSLLVVDMWRHDITPFNVIMAATRFNQKYDLDAKVHIIGALPNRRSMRDLKKVLQKAGVFGSILPKVANTEVCYRGADIVISPHRIATRVVREALACGTPVVAQTGNQFTRFTADCRDPDAFADAIRECWDWWQSAEAVERCEMTCGVAGEHFTLETTGLAAKKVYDLVLQDVEGDWFDQGPVSRKKYASYKAYLDEQRSKLPGISKETLAKYDAEYGKELEERLLPLAPQGESALCLGARQGTEVRVLRQLGMFAFGIDVNPGPDNQYVVTGDFHKLRFPDACVDVCFCNSLDHVYRINKFAQEIKRVLCHGGEFWAEIQKPRKRQRLAGRGMGSDRWASLWWSDTEKIIEAFEANGLTLIEQIPVSDSKFDVEKLIRFGRKEDNPWV